MFPSTLPLLLAKKLVHISLSSHRGAHSPRAAVVSFLNLLLVQGVWHPVGGLEAEANFSRAHIGSTPTHPVKGGPDQSE